MVFRLNLFISGMALILGSATAQAESLTRADAIRQAIVHSPEVKAAHSVYMAARARSLQAWALPDPELHLEYEGMSRVSGFDTFSERALGVSQRLEFPVRWWLRNQEAKRQARRVRDGVYEVVRREVAYRMSTLYDRVLADEHRLRFAEENARLAEAFLSRTRVRFEAGDVPRLEVMRAEVALGRGQNRVTVAQQALSVSRSALNIALGRAADAPLALTDSLQVEAVHVDTQAFGIRALQQRPELRGAEWAVLGVGAAHAMARISMLPDVSVGLFRQTVDGPAGAQGFWRAGFAVELPVWGVFRQRGMMAETSAQKAQAEAERDKMQARIAQEVTVACLNVQAVFQLLETMRDRILPTAEAAYEMARRSYDAGKATYLDVLEAHRELIDVRTEYAELLFEHRAALAQLGRAVGDDPTDGTYQDGGFE